MKCLRFPDLFPDLLIWVLVFVKWLKNNIFIKYFMPDAAKGIIAVSLD